MAPSVAASEPSEAGSASAACSPSPSSSGIELVKQEKSKKGLLVSEGRVPAAAASHIARMEPVAHCGLVPALQASLKSQVDSKQPKGDGDGAEPGEGSAAAAPGASSDGGAASAALDDDVTPAWSWRQFLAFCGPGLLMSVAYLDPGNLTADIQAGAKTGFALLWWFALVSLCCVSARCCWAGTAATLFEPHAA